MKVWIAFWKDSGSDQTEIIEVCFDEATADRAIVDYHMRDDECYTEEHEVR